MSTKHQTEVSILILLDYLFLCDEVVNFLSEKYSLNPYFIGLSILIWISLVTKPLDVVSILILLDYLFLLGKLPFFCLLPDRGLNPYFIGLSILIIWEMVNKMVEFLRSQSLFYWIIYSYL